MHLTGRSAATTAASTGQQQHGNAGSAALRLCGLCGAATAEREMPMICRETIMETDDPPPSEPPTPPLLLPAPPLQTTCRPPLATVSSQTRFLFDSTGWKHGDKEADWFSRHFFCLLAAQTNKPQSGSNVSRSPRPHGTD